MFSHNNNNNNEQKIQSSKKEQDNADILQCTTTTTSFKMADDTFKYLIANFLKPKDLARLVQVNKKANHLVNNTKINLPNFIEPKTYAEIRPKLVDISRKYAQLKNWDQELRVRKNAWENEFFHFNHPNMRQWEAIARAVSKTFFWLFVNGILTSKIANESTLLLGFNEETANSASLYSGLIAFWGSLALGALSCCTVDACIADCAQELDNVKKDIYFSLI